MATITKTIERMHGTDYVRITVELREGDARGLSDGFSVTGEVYEARGKQSGKARHARGLDCDSAGMIHDTILDCAPELKPVVDVHLADPNGVPMYAIANGWHFYRGKHEAYELKHYGAEYIARQGTERERAARALHIPVSDLPEGLDKAGFEAFANGLRARWAEQAATARKIIEGL